MNEIQRHELYRLQNQTIEATLLTSPELNTKTILESFLLPLIEILLMQEPEED